MKKYKVFSFIVAAVIAAGSFAKADSIYLGVPGYNGTGCPPGSAEAILSPDNSVLSILFSEYVAQAGFGSTGSTTGAKNCTIAIPVHVPQGLSLSIIGVDYRGLLSLPRSALARFSAEYFLAAVGQPQQRGPRMIKSFTGPTLTDYLVENDLLLSAQIHSPCGRDVNLRVNTSMMVLTPRGEDALATVDSVDVTAGVLYKLSWRTCR